MTYYKKRIGEEGEEIAAKYLEDKGYKILERNFRCKIGEIDIIAKGGDILVFIEVKSKTGLGYGSPEDMVDRRKQKKVKRVAEFYMREKEIPSQDLDWRIDILAIEFEGGRIRNIELIKNAVFDI